MSIVVAVDFGTTFSGVAWAQTKCPDVHYVINQWSQDSSSSLGGMTSDKVPSEIAYKDKKPRPGCLWGFQIPNTWNTSRLSSTYRDSRRAPPPYHASEEDVVTDYLRSLREHTVKVLELKIGRAFKGMTLDFVITVPAMWPEKAKAATFSCAERAGFGKASKLRIISEPEAAAMHALHASNPMVWKSAIRLFSVTLVVRHPGMELSVEALSSTGHFEEFLENRLSFCPGWGRDTLEEALHRFETVAKRTFCGNDDDDFHFPVLGIADNAKAGVRRGRFFVTGKEMKEIFNPAIFLVGGFGQSPYFRKYLHDHFAPGIEVLAPVDGWTAVVRGALIKTVGEICPSATGASVESRVARKNYGLRKQTSFDPKVHDDSRKGPFKSIHTTVYELDTPTGERAPMYYNDNPDIKIHATLDPPLDRIEKSCVPLVRGYDNKKYYRVSYDIRAALFSAHSEYSLWYGGKNHGTVKVDYA
ncbi:hypothetical protein SI65_06522 [Aspergillus cristatus]|uniref:Actin-like ATPase domain-containing protein n=1 Tax=Aspergillus cristatus TaxID=573508 RepID=A0A1E3B9Y6_ASPCR|nr:hypothetical protein SI65_06522 [Aspergillus cristatus]